MTGTPPSGARATALMAALFAVTLNFLQPLAHAALVRDGSPSALWTMFCHSAAADPDSDRGTLPGKSSTKHECCLGLAHAPALLAPAGVFVAALLPKTAGPPSLPAASRPAVAIRDGPHTPRGPPTFA